MKMYLANEVELEPLTVSGEPRIVQGETRDCLSFHFPASAGLEAINAAFSEENCESIRIVEDGGTEHIHAGYVIRVSLTLTPTEDDGGEGQITVTMAQRTYTEEQLLAIRRQAEATAAQMTDTQLALCEVYEMMLGSGETGEEVSDNG